MPTPGTADNTPTENYALFALAESLGKTVRELVTGAGGVLTGTEHYLWGRFRLAQARLAQQRRRK